MSDHFGLAIDHLAIDHFGLAIDYTGLACKCQQDQSRYVQSQRKESDLASGRCKARRVERAERDSL